MVNSTDDIRPMLRHAAPFGVWIAILFLPWPGREWRYLLQTLVGAGMLFWLRPWRYYGAFDRRHILPALFAGLLMLAVWVWPEAYSADRSGACGAWYLRYGVLPWGVYPKPTVLAAGIAWPWLIIRLCGSAFVIATIEEFFWRGLIMRALAGRDFLKVQFSPVPWLALIVSAAIFGVEHNRWTAGVIVGLAYGLLYLRTRDIWSAVLAHVTTNLGLGLYVLLTGNFGFWF
jgi:CAAX prenyl protease-like protein